MKITAGIDLGGTYIKGVVINELGEILLKHQLPTIGDKMGWQNYVKETYLYLKEHSPVPFDSIGLSAPGLANEQNTSIAYLPNRLPGLEGFAWGEFFGKKTLVLNDAHAALMAEAKLGQLKGKKNGIIITLGTGVGGGVLINGQLHQGLFQRAGHLGHTVVNSHDDERSILGIPGSLEYSMGNYSIQRRSYGKFESTKALLDAYKAGDTFATWLWLDSIRNLAISIASLINIFSPEAIVLAGGIVLAGDDLFNPLYELVSLYEFDPYLNPTPILKSKFDDMAGAIGAACFAMTAS